MKTRFFTLLALGLFALSSTSVKAQHKLALHTGYDFTYNAAYLGGGAIWNDFVLTTVELGYSSEQLVTKGDVAFRFLRFKESQVDMYVGGGYGYTWPSVEEAFNDQMAEVLFTINYQSIYFGYALGFYLPGDPNLEGFGNYHYFRVGVLLEDL